MGRGFIFALVTLLFGTGAFAQSNSVEQSGPITPGHVVCWTVNGVVQDCGPSTNGYANTFGLTSSGGIPFCIQDTKVHTGPYRQFCIGMSSNGASIYLNPFGGAASQNLTFVINGVTYNFPGPGNGDVSGPVTSIDGGLVCWNGTNGTLLKDCSAQLVTPLRSISSGSMDTITSTDANGTIAWDSNSTSPKTEALPVCNTASNGFTVSIKDEIATAGTYPITVSGAQTIDLQTTYIIAFSLQSITIQCDAAAANWIVK